MYVHAQQRKIALKKLMKALRGWGEEGYFVHLLDRL